MVPGFFAILGIVYLLITNEHMQGFTLIFILGCIACVIIFGLIIFGGFLLDMWCQGWDHFSKVYHSWQYNKIMKDLADKEEQPEHGTNGKK